MSWNAKEDLGPLFATPENRHPNSALALDKLAESGKLTTRRTQIACVLARYGPLADREIEALLPTQGRRGERNDASPRISEMKRQHHVEEIGSKDIEGYTSRVVSLTAAGLAWLKEQADG